MKPYLGIICSFISGSFLCYYFFDDGSVLKQYYKEQQELYKKINELSEDNSNLGVQIWDMKKEIKFLEQKYSSITSGFELQYYSTPKLSYLTDNLKRQMYDRAYYEAYIDTETKPPIDKVSLSEIYTLIKKKQLNFDLHP